MTIRKVRTIVLWGHLVASLVLALAVVLFGTSELEAHGALRRSMPASNAVLDRLPDTLRFEFTERVELSVTRIALVRDGVDTVRILSPQYGENERWVLVPVAANAVAGRYVIHWRVTGRDGHPVQGSIPFSVIGEQVASSDTGADTTAASVAVTDSSSVAAANGSDVAEQIGTGSSNSNSPLHVGLRALRLVGIVGAVGALFASLIVVAALARTGRGSTAPVMRGRITSLGISAAIVFWIAELALLMMQRGALAVGGEPPSMMELLDTSWGHGWLMRVGGGVLLALALLMLRGRTSFAHVLGVAAAVVIAVGAAFGGHAAAVDPMVPAIVADATHVVAAGAWIGTLLVLLAVILPMLRGDGEAALHAFRAFSRMAVLSVILLLGSGLYGAWQHTGELRALTSPYGRLLLAKVVLFVVIVGLGALNRRALHANRGAATVNVARRAWGEIVLAVLVVVATAILVATPTPPHAMH